MSKALGEAIVLLVDDVTITEKFSGARPVRLRPLRRGQKVLTVPKTSADNVTRRWQVVGGRGYVIRYSPELGHVEVRINMPRLAYPSDAAITYNYPLAEEVPDLTPVCEGLVKALDLGAALRGRTPSEALPLREWPVKSITYTADVQVSDAVGVTNAIRQLKRPWGSVQGWGSPAHACQWTGDHYKLLCYSKALEIQKRRNKRIPPLTGRHEEFERAHRAFREELAERANGVVRLEVTVHSKVLRRHWGVRGGYLPILRALLRPELPGFFLGRELKHLKLDQVDDNVERLPGDDAPGDHGCPSGTTDAVFLSAMLDEAITKFEQAGGVLSGSGGPRVTGSRTAQLLYVLLHDSRVDDQTLCKRGRMAPQTLAARRRNLRQLGLTTVGSSYEQVCLQEYVVGLRSVLPEWSSTPPRVLEDETLWTEAPWLKMLPVDEVDDDELHDDGASQAFEDLFVLKVAPDDADDDDDEFVIEHFELEELNRLLANVA